MVIEPKSVEGFPLASVVFALLRYSVIPFGSQFFSNNSTMLKFISCLCLLVILVSLDDTGASPLTQKTADDQRNLHGLIRVLRDVDSDVDEESDEATISKDDQNVESSKLNLNSRFGGRWDWGRGYKNFGSWGDFGPSEYYGRQEQFGYPQGQGVGQQGQWNGNWGGYPHGHGHGHGHGHDHKHGYGHWHGHGHQQGTPDYNPDFGSWNGKPYDDSCNYDHSSGVHKKFPMNPTVTDTNSVKPVREDNFDDIENTSSQPFITTARPRVQQSTFPNIDIRFNIDNNGTTDGNVNAE